MKTKLYLIILAGFFSCFTMAQSPAGEAFLIDINAFNSDGLARFMNCGNGDSLGLGDEFTIELWMRLDDYVGNQKILGKTNGNFNSGYIVGLVTLLDCKMPSHMLRCLHPQIWNWLME